MINKEVMINKDPCILEVYNGFLEQNTIKMQILQRANLCAHATPDFVL